MIAYQQKGGQNGINLKVRVRQYLEGWDFMNAATDSILHSRVATLNQVASGWIDFARSIDAVTLFGKGFGEIIEPVKVCPLWRTLPKDKHYLAASVFDLKIIQKREQTNATTMASKFEWLTPSSPVAPCESCARGASVDGHHMVQIFSPQALGTPISEKDLQKPRKLEDSGAAIFGDPPKRGPFSKNRPPREDLEEANASSTTVPLTVQDFSSPASSDSRNQESELSSFGQGSQGQGSETEATSISAPSHSSAKISQDINQGERMASEAEDSANAVASRQTANSPSTQDPTRLITPNRGMKTNLKRFMEKLRNVKGNLRR